MTEPLVVVSLEQLRAEIRSAVAEALDAQATAPDYRDRTEEALRLGISKATLDRLVREGAPVAWIGSTPRFQARAMDQFLAQRPKGSAE